MISTINDYQRKDIDGYEQNVELKDLEKKQIYMFSDIHPQVNNIIT